MRHDKLLQKAKLTRPEKNRKLRRILIVCEGEKTEPNYSGNSNLILKYSIALMYMEPVTIQFH
jgi:hypothetical protein